MLSKLLLPDENELYLENCTIREDTITIEVISRQTSANCPHCGTKSYRVHSKYQRTLADLPCTTYQLCLSWTVRRFFCDHSECQHVTFVEQLPSVAARYARKTKRLAKYQTQVAYALGGRPGERLAKANQIQVSKDTLIRLIRRAAEAPIEKSSVIGVDDWAFRKGTSYGTLMVDLEQRCPIDLLPDRSAESFAYWLKAHPDVKIISRDRGNEYRKGADDGAPNAIQIADRWHLIKNLREAIERHLERHPACLIAAGKVKNSSQETKKQARKKKTTKYEQDRQIRREKRFHRYEMVKQLHKQGFSQRQIAQRLHMGRQTVRKYLKSDQFPEYAKRKKKKSKLDPHRQYLEKRWQEGMRNASQLWRELQKEFGYSGARGMVALWAASKRKTERSKTKKHVSGSNTSSCLAPWSARRASWLLFKEENSLGTSELQTLQRMCEVRPELKIVQELSLDFLEMIRQRQPERLSDWLKRVRNVKVESLKSFGQGIEQDLSAIAAALTYEWSNGQTEGQVNRLKMIKRQMYGRANFDLLRKRFLKLSLPP